jgi:heme/copper-type cytochrome/quinol oxidase subunit 3
LYNIIEKVREKKIEKKRREEKRVEWFKRVFVCYGFVFSDWCLFVCLFFVCFDCRISLGVRNVTNLIGSVVSLFVLCPKLTLMIGIVVPIMVLIGTVYGR